MRIDARRGDRDWNVYHAGYCRMLKLVVWVDDDLMRWGEFAEPARVDPFTRDLVINEHEAKKIEFHHGRRLVVIDPVEGVDDEELQATKPIEHAA